MKNTKKPKDLIDLEKITESLTDAINSAKNHGYSAYLEQNLATINKKIEIYKAQYTSNASLVKKLKLNADKLGIYMEEEKQASLYI